MLTLKRSAATIIKSLVILKYRISNVIGFFAMSFLRKKIIVDVKI